MSAAAQAARLPRIVPAALFVSRGSIGGPVFDACLFWGSPILATGLVWLWVDLAALLPQQGFDLAVGWLAGAIALLTFAHLIAAAPRAYLNRAVFTANRLRLTIVPALLIPALLLSPSLLTIAGVLAVFWDVHHSAMQTFGLGRIYDMKEGQAGQRLRRTDLLLNWALFVGPLGFGAALASHLVELGDLRTTSLAWLASGEGLLQAQSGLVRTLACTAWVATIAGAGISYLLERRQGYRMPPRKLALLLSTGLTSVIAWGLSPPLIAFAIINLFHAVQYFALVWLKEGQSISRALGRAQPSRGALASFLGACLLFGALYSLAASTQMLLGIFVACSLLHFWFDSFIWSVQKKQV